MTRYNIETKRWEYGYWLGRVFYIVAKYPDAA